MLLVSLRTRWKARSPDPRSFNLCGPGMGIGGRYNRLKCSCIYLENILTARALCRDGEACIYVCSEKTCGAIPDTPENRRSLEAAGVAVQSD